LRRGVRYPGPPELSQSEDAFLASSSDSFSSTSSDGPSSSSTTTTTTSNNNNNSNSSGPGALGPTQANLCSMVPPKGAYHYLFKGFTDNPRTLNVVAMCPGTDGPTIFPELLPNFVLDETPGTTISGAKEYNGFRLGLYHKDVQGQDIHNTDYMSKLECDAKDCTLYLKNPDGAKDTVCDFKLEESSSKKPENVQELRVGVKCPDSPATYMIIQGPNHSFKIVVQKRPANQSFMSKILGNTMESILGSLTPVDTSFTGYKIFTVFSRVHEDSDGRQMVMALNLIAALLLHYLVPEINE